MWSSHRTNHLHMSESGWVKIIILNYQATLSRLVLPSHRVAESMERRENGVCSTEHWIFTGFRFIFKMRITPWATQVGHWTDGYLLGCQRQREKVCLFVCQTSIVSSVVRCWLHFRLQFRLENTSRKQEGRDSLKMSPSLCARRLNRDAKFPKHGCIVE